MFSPSRGNRGGWANARAIEAMKMETRVSAIHAGRILSVHAKAGAQIAMQALLFEVERVEEPANV